MKYRKVFLLFLLPLVLLSQSSAQEAQLVIPMGHAQQINSLKVSHDFTLMASVDDSNIIHIWDTKSNREILQLNDHPAGIVSIDFHPTKLELVSSDQDGNIYVWDIMSDAVKKRIKSEPGTLVIFSPDGATLWAANADLSILSLDGATIKSVKAPDRITAINFSPFYKSIVVGTQSGNFISYDPESLIVGYQINPNGAQINCIETYDETRDRIVFGSEDGFVTIVNIKNEKIPVNEKKFSKAVYSIIGNPNSGKLIIAGSDDKEDVQFFESSLEEDKSARFKWSSRRFDDTGLKGLVWADPDYDKAYLANHNSTIRIWSTMEKEISPVIIKGTSRSIYDIDVDGSEQNLIIGTRHNQIKVLDLTGSHSLQLLPGNRGGGVLQIDHHPSKKLALGSGRSNGEIKIWNTENGEILETLKRQAYLDFNMEFLTETAFIRKTGADEFEVYDYQTNRKETLEVQGALDLKISKDGTQLAFLTNENIQLHQSHDLAFSSSVSTEAISDFDFSQDGIITIEGSTIARFDESKKVFEINTLIVKDKIRVLENGNIVTFSSAISRSQEFTAFVFNDKGEKLGELSGHHDYITHVLEVQDRILTSSLDGSIKIWKKTGEKYKEIGAIIPLRGEDYVVVTPTDLFDATPIAMQEMHFTVGGEIIALEQLKGMYYEPYLLSKLMGFGDEELRKPVRISSLGFAPGVEITQFPNAGNGVLKAKVINKKGGIGRISMTINGKEVANDLRSSKNPDLPFVEIDYDLKGHPYLLENKPNKIILNAYNKDASVGSEPKQIYFLPASEHQVGEKPKIYSLVIGTSDYADEEMDLKYAAKDAEDFASALKISSTNLIGGENIEIKVLTTNNKKENWPTKTNIKKVFEAFAKKAKARDYLIVYMAGHGVNSGGDDGDFYYLTCTAKDGKVFNEGTRTNHAISSYEFTEYIKSVPALNQVMIVDACHSGTLTSAFGKENSVSKTMNSEEVRAYERMKDRTGIFLLAGSAADAVSYETTLYGQGLLTYALLFGMKGAALHEGEYIDVLDLFQFAAKKVPQLAEDIGGIQRPEVRVPTEASSFNIGKMTDADKDKIKLLQPKPVFVHTRFQDSDLMFDEIGIGKSLDTRLSKLARSDSSPIIFMNENHFSGALHVVGRYTQKGHLTVVKVKVYEDERMRLEFEVNGVNSNTIADRIMQQLKKLVDAS